MNLTELWDKIRNPDTDTIEDIGDIFQYALPITALILTAFTLNLIMIKGWLISTISIMVITHILKKVFNYTKLGRRPNGGNNSMPSGHTSAAFGGAAFIFYGVSPFLGLLAMPFAVFTGYSRVRARKHWVRDVIAGALLAFVIALVSTQPWIINLIWSIF